MAFVAAKCTQCGGDITVDDKKEAGICQFCHTAFITEKAINNYNTYITNNNNFAGVTINVTGASIENLLILAKDGEAAGNYEEAYMYYGRILEIKPDNYDALMGKGICGLYKINNTNSANAEEVINYISKAIEIKQKNENKNEVDILILQLVELLYNPVFDSCRATKPP